MTNQPTVDDAGGNALEAEDRPAVAPRVLVKLTNQAIDVASLRDHLADPDTGAHAWFEGVTRRMTAGRETTKLAYEAFEPMALTTLQRLATEACQRFDLVSIVIIHRLGEVAIGQPSIVIGCSSAHRAGALASLPWLMDRIKTDVPIWKQEHFSDGRQQWIHPQ
jgi:molybdopterin synthase catalytic subunit